MSRLSPQIVFLVMLLFYLRGAYSSNAGLVGEPKIRCIEVERQALLKIKEDLHEIKDGFLSSWGKEEEKRDCCDWYGIQCDNKSGHVIVLDLSPSTSPYEDYEEGDDWQFLRGNISNSLLELKYLNYLDLSIVDFEGNHLPSFIGTLTKLRHLNLSHSSMSGEIPPQLGNLSNLQVLDLGYNYNLTMKNMEWISHLSSLRLLDLSQTNMSKASDWMQTVNKLPYLTNLQLSQCSLPSILPSSLSLVNSSKSLAILDLSNNALSVSLYQLMFMFSRSLVHLNLRENELEGSIPEAFRNLSALEYLNLGFNQLEGLIPEALGNMTTLKYLSLTLNKLEGTIPDSLGNLTTLTHLDLGSNNLEGEFPKSLWNLCELHELNARDNNLTGLQFPEQSQLLSRCKNYSLEYLDLGWNRIMGSLPNLTLFSALKELALYMNQFSGTLPETIGQLAQLESLDLMQNSLKGVIFESHFSKLSKLAFLGLSYNSIILNVSSDWIPPFQLDEIGLACCKLGPQFPKWLQTQKNYSTLDISNAGISDFVPNWFWDLSTKCLSMDLSNNQIYGTISDVASFEFMDHPEVDLSSNNLEGSLPHSIFKVGALNLSMNRFSSLNSLCNVTDDVQLTYLDISYNQLSEELPNCWSHFKELGILILANNKLSGEIPTSIGSLTRIETMHLGNNYLTKELPSSLKSCHNLKAIDVGENRLVGPIPSWIGKSLPNLIILSLRSNHFFGNIPSQLCHLSHLQLLDLSSNNISGSVPKCLSNVTALKKKTESLYITIFHNYGFNSGQESVGASYEDELELMWKGTMSKFRSFLGLVKMIDLSSNNLKGEIPTEITELVELVFLNLSRNNLSGHIPLEVGRLNLLDALDLSNNRLSGAIPSSLTQVHRLDVLDLSNNNLSGKIPLSTQLQSFEVSSYIGNPDLCGAPLPKICPEDESTGSRAPVVQNEEDQDRFVTPGFYVSLGLGFLVGFWGFCGTLIFNKTWRYSYFKCFNDVKDWIYVRAAVRKAKLLRMIKS